MQTRDEYMKELAGQFHDSLISSYASAFSFLSHDQSRIRRAAIIECLYRWKTALDQPFSDKCLALAMRDPDANVRTMAVNALGRFHESTEDPAISRFLAGLVATGDTSDWLRHEAYMALRRVQYGFNAEDFTGHVARLEKAAREPSVNGSPKETLKAGISVSNAAVGCVEQIDTQFVDRFLS